VTTSPILREAIEAAKNEMQYLRDELSINGEDTHEDTFMVGRTDFSYAHLQTLIHAASLREPLGNEGWRPIPNGWHISWFGMDDGKYTCQIKRHDDDLDYISDISFSSSRGYTMLEAYTAALKPILDAYTLPAPPEVG